MSDTTLTPPATSTGADGGTGEWGAAFASEGGARFSGKEPAGFGTQTEEYAATALNGGNAAADLDGDDTEADDDDLTAEAIAAAEAEAEGGDPALARPWDKDERFKPELELVKTLRGADEGKRATIARVLAAEGIGPEAIDDFLAFQPIITKLKSEGWTDGAAVQAQIEANARAQEQAAAQAELNAYHAQIQADPETNYLSDELKMQLLEGKRLQLDNQAQQRFLAGQVQNQAIAEARKIIPNMTPATENLLRKYPADQVAGVAQALASQIEFETKSKVAAYAADKDKDRAKLPPQAERGARRGQVASGDRMSGEQVHPSKQSWRDVFAAASGRNNPA